MGFMDELRKLTQPYDDEDDFFEGADESFKPQQPTTEIPPQKNVFENNFAAAQPAAQPTPVRKSPVQTGGAKPFFPPKSATAKTEAPAEAQESLFGSFGKSKPPRPQRSAGLNNRDAQVILFSPKTFDEAGEIVSHILNNHSVVMTLEGIPTDTARRLLDFISGIAFALQGKITPVSAKTYFITPRNVDIIGAQNEQPESDGQYF